MKNLTSPFPIKEYSDINEYMADNIQYCTIYRNEIFDPIKIIHAQYNITHNETFNNNTFFLELKMFNIQLNTLLYIISNNSLTYPTCPQNQMLTQDQVFVQGKEILKRCLFFIKLFFQDFVDYQTLVEKYPTDRKSNTYQFWKQLNNFVTQIQNKLMIIKRGNIQQFIPQFYFIAQNSWKLYKTHYSQSLPSLSECEQFNQFFEDYSNLQIKNLQTITKELLKNNKNNLLVENTFFEQQIFLQSAQTYAKKNLIIPEQKENEIFEQVFLEIQKSIHFIGIMIDSVTQCNNNKYIHACIQIPINIIIKNLKYFESSMVKTIDLLNLSLFNNIDYFEESNDLKYFPKSEQELKSTSFLIQLYEIHKLLVKAFTFRKQQKDEKDHSNMILDKNIFIYYLWTQFRSKYP